MFLLRFTLQKSCRLETHGEQVVHDTAAQASCPKAQKREEIENKTNPHNIKQLQVGNSTREIVFLSKFDYFTEKVIFSALNGPKFLADPSRGSMKRVLFFGIAAFLVVTGVAYFTLSTFRTSDTSSRDNLSLNGYDLLKEARLIEHFCLSRVPPIVGTPMIPQEWEKALGSKIFLSEGVGEVASAVPELKQKADEIRNLKAGQSVELVTNSVGSGGHALVYKLANPGIQYLVILKNAETVKTAKVPSNRDPLLTKAALIGLISAALMSLIAFFFFRKP